jgi:hypothetical protein
MTKIWEMKFIGNPRHADCELTETFTDVRVLSLFGWILILSLKTGPWCYFQPCLSWVCKQNLFITTTPTKTRDARRLRLTDMGMPVLHWCRFAHKTVGPRGFIGSGYIHEDHPGFVCITGSHACKVSLVIHFLNSILNFGTKLGAIKGGIAVILASMANSILVCPWGRSRCQV